ncbi:MAG: hypothetical protein JO301_07195 [Chitinophagaceae bacterium]|nr:hypothetical protein [Chitinophagaceae bacterium]
METNEKELSTQESLQLIQSMINKTKNVVADDSFYFLLWGWLVFSCCLVQFYLKVYLEFPQHYYVWWLMPVGGIVSGIYGARQAKKIHVKSFVDESLDYLWIALGLSFIVLVTVNILSGRAWDTAFTYYIVLYAIGTFITGKLLRFKPLVIGGLSNFVIAIVSIKFRYEYQLLLGALAILTSYIIPGHLLRIRYLKQKH